MSVITRYKLENVKQELKQTELMLMLKYRELHIIGQSVRAYDGQLLPNQLVEDIESIRIAINSLRTKREGLLEQITSLNIELTKGEEYNVSI